MPHIIVKIDTYSIIENAIDLLKIELADAQKSENKRRVKEIRKELDRLNEELDWA